MLLASRIVKADQSDVTVEFGDAEISPDLLSNALFREFALAFDIALPTWPTVLADDGILPCLLLLAPIENMQIIHEAGSAVWEIRGGPRNSDQLVSYKKRWHTGVKNHNLKDHRK